MNSRTRFFVRTLGREELILQLRYLNVNPGVPSSPDIHGVGRGVEKKILDRGFISGTRIA